MILNQAGILNTVFTPVVGSGIVTTNLIHHYDVNESGGYSGTTLYDLSGSDDLTFMGGLTPSLPWMPFDGVNDYVTRSSVPLDMRFQFSDTFSVNMWCIINWLGNYSSYRALISTQINAPGYPGWEIATRSRPNRRKLLFMLRRDNEPAVYTWVTLANDIPINTPLYLSWTYDGTRTAGSMKVYINGVSVSVNYTSLGETSSIPYGTQNFSLGAKDTKIRFHSKIGAVHIYDDVLTATEVMQNFNATKANYGL